MKSKIIAFLGTRKPAEALAFYRDVAGLKLVADEEFALVFDAGGTMLRIAKVEDGKAAPSTALGWRVDDIETEVRDLAGRGAVFLFYKGLEQSEDGVWDTPDGTRVAWFQDPDGNVLSLTQFA